MFIHRLGARQKGAKILRPDGDGQRQADRGPDRIAPADPVPKAKDAVRRDAERPCAVHIGRDGGDMRARLIAQRFRQPGAGGAGVGHRL